MSWNIFLGKLNMISTAAAENSWPTRAYFMQPAAS